MSWIFGRKKHKESPTESNDDVSSGQDDYVVIEDANPHDSNPYPSISIAPGEPGSRPISGAGGGGGGMYPFLPGGFATKPAPPIPSQQPTAGDANQSYLNGIPFELNKAFENSSEIDRIHVDGILSFLTKIQNEDYSYDFSLEQSVISEMQSAF